MGGEGGVIGKLFDDLLRKKITPAWLEQSMFDVCCQFSFIFVSKSLRTDSRVTTQSGLHENAEDFCMTTMMMKQIQVKWQSFVVRYINHAVVTD